MIHVHVNKLPAVALLFLFFLNGCHHATQPESPDESSVFDACVTPGTSSTLEILTFNVEGFPKAGYSSVTALAALIESIDPDIVALQEVASEADFNRLADLLSGWTGIFYPINNDEWNLAYLVKESEVEIISSSTRIIFTDDSWAFPRPPFEIRVKQISSGEEIYLINLHLKCCSGTDNENSRRSASEQLKEYIDEERADDAVVMLGDYNDEISSESYSENPFLNFIDDPDNYTFADMSIATGSALWWSYPSWPSHIDHILMTNELFTSVDTTVVIKASPCYPEYEDVISDHRPVEIKLTL